MPHFLLGVYERLPSIYLLVPLLGDLALCLGGEAVDMGQGRPLHLSTDRAFAVGAVVAPKSALFANVKNKRECATEQSQDLYKSLIRLEKAPRTFICSNLEPSAKTPGRAKMRSGQLARPHEPRWWGTNHRHNITTGL
jgi:ABC-type transporter lipoprotein component MlaA